MRVAPQRGKMAGLADCSCNPQATLRTIIIMTLTIDMATAAGRVTLHHNAIPKTNCNGFAQRKRRLGEVES